MLAPHYCCECGDIGAGLCLKCKYYIISEAPSVCFVCHAPVVDYMPCPAHATHVQKYYTAGYRTDGLKRLVDHTKSRSVRAFCDTQAELIAECMPVFVCEVVVVPVPTTQKHIRVRGFDHSYAIAKTLAQHIGAEVAQLLVRNTDSVQKDAVDRNTRFRQAQEAFLCKKSLNPHALYIIVDDICTSGATLIAAAQKLQESGAKNIYATTTTLQPLDETARV